MAQQSLEDHLQPLMETWRIHITENILLRQQTIHSLHNYIHVHRFTHLSWTLNILYIDININTISDSIIHVLCAMCLQIWNYILHMYNVRKGETKSLQWLAWFCQSDLYHNSGYVAINTSRHAIYSLTLWNALKTEYSDEQGEWVYEWNRPISC